MELRHNNNNNKKNNPASVSRVYQQYKGVKTKKLNLCKIEQNAEERGKEPHLKQHYDCLSTMNSSTVTVTLEWVLANASTSVACNHVHILHT